MSKIKDSYSCSLLLTTDLIGGKWKLRILWHIIKGDNRFSLLQKSITDISEKMLTTQLREMEETGLINREVIQEKPLNVQYALTDDYPELVDIIEKLCEFSNQYSQKNNITIE